MKLKFITPKQLSGNPKATIQKSGKLGFNGDAATKLKLEVDMYIMVAINEEDEEDENLYMVLCKEKVEGGYRVSRAGEYFYVNLKYLFDELRIDYENDGSSYKIQDGDFAENGYILKKLTKK